MNDIKLCLVMRVLRQDENLAIPAFLPTATPIGTGIGIADAHFETILTPYLRDRDSRQIRPSARTNSYHLKVQPTRGMRREVNLRDPLSPPYESFGRSELDE